MPTAHFPGGGGGGEAVTLAMTARPRKSDFLYRIFAALPTHQCTISIRFEPFSIEKASIRPLDSENSLSENVHFCGRPIYRFSFQVTETTELTKSYQIERN